MKYLSALGTLCALLISASVGFGQSITLPATVNAAKPGLITITPTQVIGDCVRWVTIDDGLQLIPASLLKDDKIAVGVALQPGSYRVRAIAATVIGGKAVMSEPTETTVIVGGTPTPPNPPGPPTPTDPLTQEMQAAYNSDADPQKSTNLAVFADVLSLVVGQAKSSGKVTTLLQLQTVVKAAADNAVGTSSLPSVRKEVGTYLLTKLPSTDGPMTDTLWATAAAEYANVANALKRVKVGK